MSNIANHVAIIMDGNGRWAKERHLPLVAGHKAGAKTAFDIVEKAYKLGISWITLYTFSTENWKRPALWVDSFKTLLGWYLDNEIVKLIDNNVRLHVIGDINAFGDDINARIQGALLKTKNNTGINLVIALNYGARAEIVNASRKIAQDIVKGSLKIEAITDHVFEQYLETHFMPNPDLLIRTSGEYRISNYLLWQIAYAELAFCEKYWPDFTSDDFEIIINQYSKRERRFGNYTDTV